jgi:hypothetical protein
LSEGRRSGRRHALPSATCVVFTMRWTKMPGKSISSGGITPGSTISSTSTIAQRADFAKLGLKFWLPPRNCTLPRRSAR